MGDDLHPSAGRRTAEITALRAISRAIGQALDLDTTLQLITRTTAAVMGMDSCSIYLLDPSGEYLVLKATTGLAEGAIGRESAYALQFVAKGNTFEQLHDEERASRHANADVVDRDDVGIGQRSSALSLDLKASDG